MFRPRSACNYVRDLSSLLTLLAKFVNSHIRASSFFSVLDYVRHLDLFDLPAEQLFILSRRVARGARTSPAKLLAGKLRRNRVILPSTWTLTSGVNGTRYEGHARGQLFCFSPRAS